MRINFNYYDYNCNIMINYQKFLNYISDNIIFND
jgi:hypothetical protein